MSSSTTTPIPIKQRHRSSFSQHQQALRKRRPSDVDRDRTTSSRLAALSLSPPGVNTQNQTTVSKSAPLDEAAAGATGSGKKKGAIFKCETCAKAYRHPSCLVKHRWEHSPHWREASKFLLSKHQQVQLLEAAAILSHLSPTKSGGGTSLPEDRSLWPSYLSGGLLPMPTTNVRPPTTTKPLPPRTNINPHPTPNANANHDDNSSMSTSDDESEPETHNGSVASPYGGASKPLPTPIPALTQFRPGLLGHPNPPTPASSLPTQPSGTGAMAIPGSSAGGSSWGQHAHVVTSAPAQGIYGSLGAGVGAYYGQSPFSYGSGPNAFGSSSASGPGFSFDSEAEAGGRGWSLPRSSVRSGGEESEEEVDILGDADMNAGKGKSVVEEKDKSNANEEDWDMEMDM